MSHDDSQVALCSTWLVIAILQNTQCLTRLVKRQDTLACMQACVQAYTFQVNRDCAGTTLDVLFFAAPCRIDGQKVLRRYYPEKSSIKGPMMR
jgi:hypothetical protein